SASACGRRCGDLRPTTFSPRAPIAGTERGEQWHKIAERDKRQRERKRARVTTRCISDFPLRSRGIIPADVIPQRDRDPDGQTAKSVRVFRREWLPWDVSDPERARERQR